ncbi:hypothetical protein RSOLAG1IB_01646 [Rhizoctonia solani AG-1 IB]|uniref:Uncharacterized protein n=1 Tax=Thanatephorus cucumeris (strain AG1-IB / isolate 7/3/14) TaxID=1108050 RepID=M5C1D9_THACB|nr:hypothetical protein BN14_03650 [Rhizoctonia solani AG-1 IB]CEL55634.1 hypothetical protein RSOLAG1IB_01646 [Rhizoctonia solani AG-1 IB]
MMKFAAASLLAFAALAVAQQDPAINSPASVVQCQPVQLSWTASKEPVYVSIIPGGQPGAAPLHDFGIQAKNTTSMTWMVNFKAGTSVSLQVKDSTGAVAYSSTISIQNSSDASCLNGQQPPSPGGSSAATQPAPGTTGASSPTTQATGPTTAPAGTPPASSSAGASTPRSPATATSAPAPTGTNAAAANDALPIAQVGWTGLVGVLAALIVA